MDIPRLEGDPSDEELRPATNCDMCSVESTWLYNIWWRDDGYLYGKPLCYDCAGQLIDRILYDPKVTDITYAARASTNVMWIKMGGLKLENPFDDVTK